MPEYRIEIARTTIEEFVVSARDPDDLQEKWPAVIGLIDPINSYSDGDVLMSYTDEDTDETTVVGGGHGDKATG